MVEPAISVERLSKRYRLDASGSGPAFFDWLRASLAGQPRDDDPRTVLAHLREAPVPAPDRDVLEAFLRARGISESVVAWLLTSARRDPDGWRFVYDLPGVEQMLRSYLDTDVWPWLEATAFPVHLVRGARSPVWSAPDLARLAALPPGGPVDVSVQNAGIITIAMCSPHST